jgi:predicted dehydrogenase
MNINRRRFLEMTSALAGSAFIAASAPWVSAMHAQTPVGRAASDRVRLGFVGVGNRGRTLLRNVKASAQHANVEIVAVCDDYEPFYERAQTLTDNKVPAFRDYREMFDKVEMDGVVIATPPDQHAGPTVAAFEKGVHVFCEKAMARTLDDIKLMYDKHIEHNKIMLIGFQRLYSPVYLTAIERIRSGAYGPITMVKGNWHRNTDWITYPQYAPGTAMDRKMNWRLYTDTSGGMITELCSHHLHIANWVLDEQPVNVVGSGSINYWKDHRQVWDNFGLVFQYPDGTHFTYSCLQSNKHNGVQVQALGKEGMLDLEVNREFNENPPAPPAIRQLIHDIETRLFDTIPIGGATWVPAEPVKYGGEFISNNWEMNETQLFLEAFVDFIREGSAPEELAISGYNASTWALLAEQATKSNERVTLPAKYKL